MKLLKNISYCKFGTTANKVDNMNMSLCLYMPYVYIYVYIYYVCQCVGLL